jgi:membrane-bound inhibitor of C-type lysozyme
MRMRTLPAAAMVFGVMAGCQPKMKLPGMVEYTCEDGKKFVVDYGAEQKADSKAAEATFHFGETAVRLPRQAVASGVKYSDEISTFLSKGGDASLKTPDGLYKGCKATP